MKQICVIGLGQFGSHLARTLARMKCDVLAIDVDETAVTAIRDDVQQALMIDVRSLDAARRRATISALLEATIERTKRQDALDEAGCLVPLPAVDLYEAAVAEGFTSLGQYQVLAHEFSTP